MIKIVGKDKKIQIGHRSHIGSKNSLTAMCKFFVGIIPPGKNYDKMGFIQALNKFSACCRFCFSVCHQSGGSHEPAPGELDTPIFVVFTDVQNSTQLWYYVLEIKYFTFHLLLLNRETFPEWMNPALKVISFYLAL